MYMYVDACVLCIFVTASVSMSLSMKQIIHVNMRATRMCTCERMHLATRVPQSAFCSKMYRIRMSEYEDVFFPTCSSIPKPNMIPAVQKTNSICFFTTNLCLTHRPLRHHVLGSLHISPRQGSTWTLLSKDLWWFMHGPVCCMLWGWSLLEAEISCEFRMRCVQKTHVNTPQYASTKLCWRSHCWNLT